MKELNFNIFNVIIISGVIHGLLFSAFVLLNKKIKNNKYLALTVLFLSLSNLQYWAIDIHVVNLYPVFNYIFIPSHWLILPMFYLYVEKYIQKPSLPLVKKALLISPFFIVLLMHLFQVFFKLFIDNSYVIPSHFKRGLYVYIEFFSFIFNITIIILSYLRLKSYENELPFNSRELKPDIQWLKQLIYIGLAICVFWLIALIIIVIYDLDKSYVFYPMWIGISALVYWMGHIGLGKSQLLEERIALRQQRSMVIEEKIISKNSSSTIETFQKLNRVIENKKLYLNPELNIETLSTELNLKATTISQLVNQNTDYNFNDYINSYRVAETKKMLSNPEYSNYTIVAIGLEAGFNSKASFYRAFRKFEGMTPSEYQKNRSQIP
ncbi:helix-turn-helix domain-containing protein [Flavobacterium sp.]|jgi:AraC-like DNA-binding protein|uniref:helix-turn-helix domain-containing protein n=1 Tax=Flavobacterium sp. TaxID=239 RepID=UPI0037BE8B69